MTSQAATILITGSSRGIGKATATIASKRGLNVIVHGRTDSPQLNKLHQSLPNCRKVVFSVDDSEAVQEEIQKLGRIDILVNAAGVALGRFDDINDLDDEIALQEYRTNLLGTLHCIEAVIPGMVERRFGRIINIASIKGHPNLSTLSTLTYAASKAGILSITKSLAKKYSPMGIFINSVSPGYTETDQAKDWPKETYQRISQGTLLGRMAQAEDIARVILFLCGDDANYITGTDLLVDGGYELRGK